jgi:hypothetical protein
VPVCPLFFGNEAERRHPVVVKRTREAARLREGDSFFHGAELEVSGCFAHDIQSFSPRSDRRFANSCHFCGTGSGSLNAPLKAPCEQRFVDEFPAVGVTRPRERERKPALNVPKASKPRDWPRSGGRAPFPLRKHVRPRQSLAERFASQGRLDRSCCATTHSLPPPLPKKIHSQLISSAFPRRGLPVCPPPPALLVPFSVLFLDITQDRRFFS